MSGSIGLMFEYFYFLSEDISSNARKPYLMAWNILLMSENKYLILGAYILISEKSAQMSLSMIVWPENKIFWYETASWQRKLLFQHVQMLSASWSMHHWPSVCEVVCNEHSTYSNLYDSRAGVRKINVSQHKWHEFIRSALARHLILERARVRRRQLNIANKNIDPNPKLPHAL